MSGSRIMLRTNKETLQRYAIGLDPSLTSFGCYFLNLDHGEDYWVSIQSKPDHGSDTRRVIDIANSVLQEIGNLDGQIAVTVMEDYGPINRTSGKITQRAEICGIIKNSLMYGDGPRPPLITVPPTSLKEFATTKGNASKGDMLTAANNLGFFPDTNDEADAFFLARIGMRILAGGRLGIVYTKNVR
jgi:hypothetical protein